MLRAEVAPDTLDLKGAAEYLHLGVRATRKLFEDGELPGLSTNQKHCVFLRADLEEYVRTTARRQAEQRRITKLRAESRPRRGRRAPLPNLDSLEMELGRGG